MAIYEIRTYGLKPGSLAEVEKRFAEGYEARKKYSPLTAFWHTEIGPLNEIVHVWAYPDHAERARVRAAAANDPNWPPKIQDFIVSMQSEILVPFPSSPTPAPGKMGPIYEMRYYTIRAGSLPATIQRWESKLPDRLKLSPLVLVGHVEHGEANRFIHIWGYESLDHRAAVRKKAVETGVWPPPGGAEVLLTQANKIMVPASFSPLQ
jgi:NIPSNAP